MRLPIIKTLTEFTETRDEDFLLETAETLEWLCDAPGIKEDELDVIGELLSNIYGAIEVNKMIKDGSDKRDALNGFMKRVMGSIDN